jgi:uncharacterized protein (UPF0335 family)
MTDSRLKSYVERIDRLMTVADDARKDIGEIVKEAKGDGYIPKTLRKVATRFHADPNKIATEDALLETYEAALGRVGKALKAIAGGATWEEARKAHDVPRATLARAAAVSKHREMIPNPDALNLAPDSAPESVSGTNLEIGDETSPIAVSVTEVSQEADRAALHVGGEAEIAPRSNLDDDDPGPIPHFLRRPKQEASV